MHQPGDGSFPLCSEAFYAWSGAVVAKGSITVKSYIFFG